MFRQLAFVLAAASLATTALAAPATGMRPMARPPVPDRSTPSTPSSARRPPPGGPDAGAGLAQRDQAIQQMRAAAILQDAQQSNATAESARRLTVFAPGGEQLLKSMTSQSAATPDVQGARERPGESATDAVASLQPGVRSLNGRASGAQITVGAPARLVIAGFAPQSICDLQVRVLSRSLPDNFPLHKDEHLSPDLNLHRLPGGGDAAPTPSAPPLPPLRELPVNVVGGDITALCGGGAGSQPMRSRAYALNIVIPDRVLGHVDGGFETSLRTGGFDDDPSAVIEVQASDGTTYQMSGVTLVALREPLQLTIYRSSPFQVTYKVTYGNWKPLGIAPYRFAEGQSIDCPSTGGGDLINFTGLKHGFALVSANMITDRVDTGDGDGFHNAGGRVMLGDYGIVFNDDHSFFATWGVWRSHRSEVGITSGMGAVADVRPAHDICLSNYYLSVTIIGPLGMAPW